MHAAVSTLAFFVLVSTAFAGTSLRAEESKIGTSTKPAILKPLDLRPPDISKMRAFARTARIPFREEPEEISVIGEPELLPQTDSESPTPWMGVGASLWAFIHPSGAWWVFAPTSAGRAARLGDKPDLNYEIFRIASK